MFELYSLVAGCPSCPWCYAPILSFRRAATGATFARSQESELSDSLCLVICALACKASKRRSRGKSFLLQKAEKDSHECDCPLPHARLCANSSDLNYAPCGSNLLALLTSELVDSAARRYLRRIRFAGRATGGKSLLLRTKRKIPSVRMDARYLWRSRRDLNSRAGRPDLHP